MSAIGSILIEISCLFTFSLLIIMYVIFMANKIFCLSVVCLIQCCFNVGPASHTVIQHSAGRETSQCVDWRPSECVSICQAKINVFTSTKTGDLILITKI